MTSTPAEFLKKNLERATGQFADSAWPNSS